MRRWFRTEFKGAFTVWLLQLANCDPEACPEFLKVVAFFRGRALLPLPSISLVEHQHGTRRVNSCKHQPVMTVSCKIHVLDWHHHIEHSQILYLFVVLSFWRATERRNLFFRDGKVGLVNIELGDKWEFKVKQAHEFFFTVEDIAPPERIMSDLFSNDAWMKWINVLVFRGQIHAGNARPMNVVVCQLALLHWEWPSQVLIKQSHC